MTRLPGMPGFQHQGVFRGSHAYFMAMDEEMARLRQAWFQRLAKRPA